MHLPYLLLLLLPSLPHFPSVFLNRLEGGVCVVSVSGRSYFTPEPLGEERRRESIDLERGDAAVRGMLDDHGVSLAACVQTFDVMQVSVVPNEDSVWVKGLIFLAPKHYHSWCAGAWLLALARLRLGSRKR